ncbi:MAG: hypothetical protein H6936_13695 [Burkholderiales bacterium]|nr:hypothetical protein [Nitrosomonas sp.]MCP5275876.1 hypothetical protein [Burkholderiales bacterium]
MSPNRLSEELGPLTKKQQELVTTLKLVRIEEFIFTPRGFPERPAQDRAAIARVFVAKMIYNLPTTRALLERLASDKSYVIFAVGEVSITFRMNGCFCVRLPRCYVPFDVWHSCADSESADDYSHMKAL